ncbi:DEAD/DEAH box helicase [Patulibacter sp.]|uniref:DEAD/DEAH box helicase n=1 Tax=Patulibacter sp. TaxID=1912859 RepID=UPI0027255BEF|nr:DEAD/DEAH box helicase [Patulibacter sp.]MDO9408258.1 DEAD/DEAH box helicase [Patulibacter sp.]
MNDAVRTIPGRYFDWSNHVWRAPLGVHAAIVARRLLDDTRAELFPDEHVSAWLGGMSRWHGETTVIELDDGPRLAVVTLIGEPPSRLTDAAERLSPEAAEEALGIESRAVDLLPFDADGVALLDRIDGLVVDTLVMLASAELRMGRMPAAATLRAGRDDQRTPRVELLPGWSTRLHAAFGRLPEAVPLDTTPGRGYRRGDAPIDAATSLAVPADPSLLPALEELIREHPTLVVTTAARDLLAVMRVEHEERIETIDLSQAERASPLKRTRAGEPLRLGGVLQPFQHAGVRYLIKRRRSFLADEQGLGKTVQALATLEVDGAYPAVVVCPAGMKLTWEREAAKWLPHRRVAVLHGRGQVQWEPRDAERPTLKAVADRPNPFATPLDVSGFAEPRDADIVVLNYEIVEAHLDPLAARVPRAVVFDESHYCKQPTAKRTKAAMKLSKSVHPDGLRLALTGTPVLNQPRELTAQLRLIDRLKDFGSGAELARRFKGPESHDRLHWHLRSRGFVRRLKQDVLPQLPAKRRVDVPLELKDPAEYRLAEKDVIAWLRTQPLDLSELDAKIAAALRAEQLVRMNHLRRLAARGKLPGAMAWVESFLASGEALVVFAQHREVQLALLERFPGALHILGDDTAIQRDEAVKRFQAGGHLDIENPAERLIVCSMRAAAQGITLTRASNVAFLELDWTPAMHDQAEDRCHRIGQDDAVTAWYLLCPGTIDDEMSDILQVKRQVIDAVVDGNQLPDEPVSLAVVRALRERGRATGESPDGPADED